MNRRVAIFAAALAVWSVPATRSQTQPPGAAYRAVVDQYCVSCHNQRAKIAGLALDSFDVTNPSADAEVWEKVVRKVRVGMMPPQGSPQPEDTTRRGFVSYLETELDRAAAAHPNPGSPLAHRLNRAEYANAIRDLLAVEVDGAMLLPPDTQAHGFDTNADALSMEPALLDRYLTPCTNSAPCCSTCCGDMPRSAAIRRTAASTPRLGSAGTEGTFATQVAPVASASTRSVNVPPTSTPMRQGACGCRVAVVSVAIASQSPYVHAVLHIAAGDIHRPLERLAFEASDHKTSALSRGK
jgi:mono/diheme cytochrome c family protein